MHRVPPVSSYSLVARGLARAGLIASLMGSMPGFASAGSQRVATNPDGDWFSGSPTADGCTLVYDAARDRHIVFGGSDLVWELDLAADTLAKLVSTSGTPPARRTGHAAIYDPVRDRMIVLGGRGASIYTDVWELSFAGTPTWSELHPSGTAPDLTPLNGFFAVYDPVRDRMLVETADATWELSLGASPAWTRIHQHSNPLEWFRAAYNSTDDRLVVIGTRSSDSKYGVYELTLSDPPTWTLLTLVPSGAAVFGTPIDDPLRHRLIVFRGPSDLAELSFSTHSWSLFSDYGPPPPAVDPALVDVAVYDPPRDRVLVDQGGVLAALTFPSPQRNYYFWVTILEFPHYRYAFSSAYDPFRRRMVIFGGSDFDSARTDVWQLDLTKYPVWSPLPAATPPGAGYRAIYDTYGDRVVTYGGPSVWALSPAGAWSELSPPGAPPSPAYGRNSAVFDPARRSMLVFGSSNGNDVWELTLHGAPAWSTLATSGTPPPPRGGHVAVYDPIGDRMIVFGGINGGGDLNDLWELSLAGTPTWAPLAASGTPPPPRINATAIYDPVRERIVVYGGRQTCCFLDLNDVWELSLAGAPAWTRLSPGGDTAPGVDLHEAIYDPSGDQMVVFGGYEPLPGCPCVTVEGRTFFLRWGGLPPSAVPYPDRSVAEVTLDRVAPNPARGPVTIDFALPVAAEVRVTILDVQGRRLATVARGGFSPGGHRVTWEAAKGRGAPPAGIYFIRLEAAGVSRVRRIVVSS